MSIDWRDWLVDLPVAWDIGLRITAVLAVTWLVHMMLARRNPRWRTLLWRLTVVGLVMIPLLVAAIPRVQFAVKPSGTLGSSPRQFDGNDPWLMSAGHDAAKSGTSAAEPIQRTSADSSDDPLRQPAAVAEEAYLPTTAGSRLWWALCACWGLGAGILAFRWFAAQLRVRRSLAHCGTAPESCLLGLNRTRARLGCRQPIGLRLSSEADVPFVAGLLRPVVVLPARMADPDNAKELPAIYAHELAHHKSRDLLWMGLLQWAGILLWFHPLVWRISRAHAAACEEAADATAARLVGDVREYSGTVARVALHALASPSAALTIPMARSHEVVSRLEKLKRGPLFLPLHRRTVLVSVVIAGVALLTVAGFELVRAESNVIVGGGTRTIEFPKDRSVGIVLIASDNQPEWLARVEGIRYPKQWNWSWHGAARGTVKIPAGAKVKLLLSDAGTQGTGWVSQIGPNDLHTLEIVDPRLADAQLANLVRLTGLEQLRLRNCQVSDGGLQALQAMTSLRLLWLELANVTNEGLRRVGQLPSLEALAIIGGRWNDEGLAHLARLHSLREFYYSPQQVRGPGLAHVARLPSLRYVYSGGAAFTDQHLAAWSRAKSLRGLHIQLAKITDGGFEHIENLKELEYLDLWQCGVTGAGLVHLKPLSKLKQLHILMPVRKDGTSELSVRDLAQLAGLQSLERLDLPKRGMTDEHCEQVSRLKNLKFLRIGESSDSPISDAGLEHLAKLANLESLYIGGAGITDRGMAHLASLPQLRHLHPVYVPRVTNAGFAKLGALESLETLFMPLESRVTISGLSHLNGLSNLRYLVFDSAQPPAPGEKALDISGMTRLEMLILPPVRDEDLACLREMRDLQQLTLNNPASGGATVGDQGVAHLANVTSLKQLNIGSIAMTDAGLVHLTGMRQLCNLTVTGRFTDEAVEHLEKLEGLRSLVIYSSNKLSAAAKQRLRRNLPNLVTLDDSGCPNPAKACPIRPPGDGR